jgi:hypothetical protein
MQQYRRKRDPGNTETGGAMMDTKKCTKCGEIKSVSEFYKRSDSDRPRPMCKKCESKWVVEHVDKEQRKMYERSPRGIQAIKRRGANARKKRLCAKVFCKDLPKEKIVSLICPVCNNAFGVLPHLLWKKRNGIYEMRKYCSRVCQYIAKRKSWQQTHSPYAKKIKELRKTHGV